MDHILHQIFKIILNIFKKPWRTTVNPSIRRCINQIENRIMFEIETGYYLELLTPPTMELFESTKTKIRKN